MAEGELGAKKYNSIIDQLKQYGRERVALYRSEILIDGHPPGTVMLSPIAEYHKLVVWSQSGDPRYTPAAAARLAQLSLRYGAPPAIPNALEPSVRNDPRMEARDSRLLGQGGTSAMSAPPLLPGGP